MHLRTGILGSLLLGTWVFAAVALAGPGGAGEGKGHGGATPKAGRLGVPANVFCTKSGDQLTLSWDAVDGATQYRVYLEAEDGGELVDTVSMPPYTHPMSDISEDPTTEVKGHVRAMASKMGRDASKPSAQATCK